MDALADVNAACNLTFEKARRERLFVGKTSDQIKDLMVSGVLELLPEYNKEEARQLVLMWFDALRDKVLSST